MGARQARISVGVGVVAALVSILLVLPTANATFPGSNGLLSWIQDGDLWTALPNGSSAAKLLDDADHPAWSVDGAWVLFDRDFSGSGEIVKATANASVVTRLTTDAADDIEPAWSPDNTRMVFSSNRIGGEYRLYIMNTDGSGGLVPLTNGDNLGTGTDDHSPEWSPNGQRIIFQRGDGAGGSNIWSINANGTNAFQVNPETAPGGEAFTKLVTPKWSPNGQNIVFASEADACNSRIWVMAAANGANLDDVPDGGCLVAEPTWSPDGTIILFRLTAGPTGDGLYGYNIGGNSISELIGGAGATTPDWQPIGGSPVTTTTTTTSTSVPNTTVTTATTVPPTKDKKSRPLVVRAGRWFLRNTASTGVADLVFDYGNPSGDVAVTGDWDGNGSTTPGVVRNGTWFLRQSNTSGVADLTFNYGNPGDLAITGDWDGNGTVTPGVVRGGQWFLRNSNTTGVADVTFLYGNPGDLPVPGDWDSTGTFTPGVVRNGAWFVRNSNTTGVADATFGFGNPGDIPLPGDWDGNGSTTPGVVRSGTWFIRNSNTTGTAEASFGYGDPSDKPLTWQNA